MSTDKEKKIKHKSLAKDLLKSYSAEEVVTALLRYSFKNELDTKNYQQITDAEFTKNSKGQRRSGKGRRSGGGKASYGKNQRGKRTGGRRHR